MKNVKTLFITILTGSSLLLLAACGGGGGGGDAAPSGSGGGGSPASAGSISGKIADGYLRDARVFLDRNNNRLYDNGEPVTTSTAGGRYTLEITPGEGDRYPVVAEVIAGQTVDEDTGLPVANDYLLEAPAGKWAFVSPLTTLVKAEREKNPSFTELQAVLKVRSQLGIDDNVSLFEDYLAQNANVGKAASGAQLAEEYRRAHKAARIVAELLGSLRADITQNLGGQIAAAEQHAVAYLVTDQVMDKCAAVKQALATERNGGQPADVNSLKATVKAAINGAMLNLDLVVRYQQRSEQKPQVWDMQPPDLVSKTPQDKDKSSVDVTIGMLFDEALDETTIDDSLVVLSGPDGPLSGYVSYDASQKKLSFVPDQVLLPYASYQVTLKKDLADALGNPLEEDLSWTFSTIFDKTPPTLPDF